MLVIGAKEVEEGTVSVRSRVTGETEVMKFEDFMNKIKKEVENKE